MKGRVVLMNVPNAPLQRTSLRDQLSQRLEQMILRGEISPGAHLPSERELVEQWGVSRAVVRDAIRILESKGLVEVRHGVGAVVKEDVREAFARALELLERGNYRLSELMRLRTVLEVEAARLAAERATPADLERMEADLERFSAAVQAGDVANVVEADRAFHLHLIEATRTEPLMDIIAPIVRCFMARTLFMAESKDTESRTRNVEEHRQILDGIRAGDPEKAAHWMRVTLERSDVMKASLSDAGRSGIPCRQAAGEPPFPLRRA